MSDHEWCRDTARDEAVRAAEDAANWRRLEVGEVVQAGDEYRNCWGWQPVPTAWCGQALGDGFWTVRRRIPSAPQHRDLPEVVADLRERVARVEAAVMPKSVSGSIAESLENKGGTMPAEGLRTKRVTLEVRWNPDREPWSRVAEWLQAALLSEWFGAPGESVRVVEDDLPAVHDTDGDRVVMSWPQLAKCLTAERDAAIRERDAALADVAALQRERDDALLVLPACCGRLSDAAATVVQERGAAREECERLRARVAELEAAAPPRGWLTAEEREAVKWLSELDKPQYLDVPRKHARVAQALLARETPTRVPPPPRGWLTAEERDLIAGLADDDVFTEEGQNIAKALLARETPPKVKVPIAGSDFAWIAAIREAGVEVEEC